MNTLEKINTNVKIVDQQEKVLLSPSQKMFNRLIKKINKEREILATWETTIPLYQKKYAAELIPLKKSYDESRADLVKLLDNIYAAHKFSKSERQTISHLIQSISSELIFENKMEDLKEIFNKYSEQTYDEYIAHEKDQLSTALKDFIGIDLGDVDDIDLNSPEDLFKNIFEKMAQGVEDDLRFEEARKANRKKTAKMLAKEAKEKEETEQASKSIREIFRTLAKILHPDREQNSEERNRKNILMQRANVAYKAKDLLTLLELQLEVEQIDQTAVHGIAESRLKHYNKVLKEQLFELGREIDMLRVRFMIQNKINNEKQDIEVHELLPFLSQEIWYFQKELHQIQNELVMLQDITGFKRWLRQQSFFIGKAFQ